MREHELLEDDEFMVVACDGLWDVLTSQRCVELARQHLREHNDAAACAKYLVRARLCASSVAVTALWHYLE